MKANEYRYVGITVKHVIVEVCVQDNKNVKICFLRNDSFIDSTVNKETISEYKAYMVLLLKT